MSNSSTLVMFQYHRQRRLRVAFVSLKLQNIIFIYSYFYIAKWSSETTLKNGAKPKSLTSREKTIRTIFFMKIKIIVTLLFTLALKFNVIAAERVENEKKATESVFAVAKATTFTGIVKWFDKQKGFGFITPDGEGEKDVWVHHSVIKGDKKFLVQGQKVEFEIIQGPKGLQASSVKVVD